MNIRKHEDIEGPLNLRVLKAPMSAKIALAVTIAAYFAPLIYVLLT